MTGPRQLADRPLDCAGIELLLVEIVERTLSPIMAGRVHRHTAGCAACKERVAQASRGRNWLLALKRETLEPPVDLVAKIVARTRYGDGADSPLPIPDSKDRAGARKTVFGEAAGEIGTSTWQRNSVVVLRRTLLDPRLALVAAMAFFSISLTLNMLGLRFSGLHASDLQPKNLHRTLTRQVAETQARVVRYYENLRVVYEVEAQVQQMRRAAENNMPPPQAVRPRNQSSNSSGPLPHRRMGSNPDSLAINARERRLT